MKLERKNERNAGHGGCCQKNATIHFRLRSEAGRTFAQSKIFGNGESVD
jgi:hypothetical protein